jgi:hypothetical protein
MRTAGAEHYDTLTHYFLPHLFVTSVVEKSQVNPVASTTSKSFWVWMQPALHPALPNRSGGAAHGAPLSFTKGDVHIP